MGCILKGGNWEVARPTAIARLKMEDACILCNVIEFFLTEKSNQNRKRRALYPFEVPLVHWYLHLLEQGLLELVVNGENVRD
jgi:hypothetical protein